MIAGTNSFYIKYRSAFFLNGFYSNAGLGVEEELMAVFAEMLLMVKMGKPPTIDMFLSAFLMNDDLSV